MRFVFVSEIAAGCGARRSLSTQTSRSGRLANEIEIKIGESALSWGVGRGHPRSRSTNSISKAQILLCRKRRTIIRMCYAVRVGFFECVHKRPDGIDRKLRPGVLP